MCLSWKMDGILTSYTFWIMELVVFSFLHRMAQNSVKFVVGSKQALNDFRACILNSNLTFDFILSNCSFNLYVYYLYHIIDTC